MIKHRLCAFAAAMLLGSSACAATWETIAGAPVALHAAPLDAPRGIAAGSDGAIYFTDGAAVRVLRADGTLATLAGRFVAPAGLAVAADGTVFVADAGNHVVKAISPAGELRTVAGHAGAAGRADGRGIVAGFDRPAGLALEASGALLVADAGNHALRRIAPNGVVSTVAQRLPLQPQGVVVDARGGMVVHDAAMALRIDAGGSWQELLPPAQQADSAALADRDAAGGPCERGKCLRRYQAPSMPLAPHAQGRAADGQAAKGLATEDLAVHGRAAQARAAGRPAAEGTTAQGRGVADRAAVGQMAADGQGRLLATAPASGSIYRIERNGLITPLVGAGDVTGELSGAAVGRDGSTYLLLAGRQAAASWDAGGKPQPFKLQYAASLNRDGPALQARFGDINQLAVGRDGGLYVLDGDQLRRIDKDGIVRTLQQEGGFHKLREPHAAAQVDLHGAMVARSSTGVFVTADGALASVSTEGMISFVSGPPGMAPDQTGFAPALRRIWAYAMQSAEPFMLPGLGRHRIGADASGQAWYCADNVLWRIRPRGEARKIALQGNDGCGDVLVAPNDDVFLLHGHYLTRVGADGMQWLAAGSRERKGSGDGAGLLARFRRITQATVDANNNIYLLDDGILRRMSADGEVTTEGKALFAAVGKLRALAADRKGVLYLATERTILRMKP